MDSHDLFKVGGKGAVNKLGSLTTDLLVESINCNGHPPRLLLTFFGNFLAVDFLTHPHPLADEALYYSTIYSNSARRLAVWTPALGQTESYSVQSCLLLAATINPASR